MHLNLLALIPHDELEIYHAVLGRRRDLDVMPFPSLRRVEVE